MPDPQQAQQIMERLALTGATTVVAAMATDIWGTARTGIIRLFERRNKSTAVIEGMLDDDAAILAGLTEGEEADAARRDLASTWRWRLRDLLREYPDTAAGLEALVDQLCDELPFSGRTFAQNVIARENGHAFGTLLGNLTVHQHFDGKPPPPSSVEKDADGTP